MVHWARILSFLLALTGIQCGTSTNRNSEDQNQTQLGTFEQKELISAVSQENLLGPATGIIGPNLSLDVSILGKEMIQRIQQQTGAITELDPPTGYQFAAKNGETVEKFVFVGRVKNGSKPIHLSLHAIQSPNTIFSWGEWAFLDPETSAWSIEILVRDAADSVTALKPAEFRTLFKGDAGGLSQKSAALSFDACGAVSQGCGTLLSGGYEALCKWGAITIGIQAVGCVGAIVTDAVGFIADDLLCVSLFTTLELRPVLCSVPACIFANFAIDLGCDVGVKCLIGKPFGCHCPWALGSCLGACDAIANFSVEHLVCESTFNCAPGGLITPILKMCKKLGKESICDAVVGGMCSQIYEQSVGQGVDMACENVCGVSPPSEQTPNTSEPHQRSGTSSSEDSDDAEDGVPGNTSPPDGFWCDAGFIIPISFVCDGLLDCPGGDDEDCASDEHCSPDQWACQDKTCIPQVCRCDGYYHCEGGEDEAGCGP